MKNGELASPFNNEQCFGFGGASGSMAFADPVNQIGYSYVPNTQGYDFPDGRDVGIQRVLYEIIGQLYESITGDFLSCNYFTIKQRNENHLRINYIKRRLLWKKAKRMKS